ncbi:copper homeostasis protein CutC [Aerococcus kribbianus]|uniref:Copper homeostasis protein cutC homolog n=1 Tax=Aerococcus kribbianus TaxID=2999064 RepID=A0A9X3JF27_9LACT|nr:MULTISPECIES: copper homeostasis protein CutC [unclassified Aerococcus]MCZ0717800.1 copper homeostasis protein CutC [Aerococcus sp. YH-aer221]MCZ0726087.1 copper homeostasis protein CutC [Aerococcus sp. YH-aer222]
MLLEACVENFTDIPEKLASGAQRVELCDNLAVGGTTPSYGVLKHSLAYSQAHPLAIVAMLRNRGGDFNYTSDDKAIMWTDLQMMADLGVRSIAVGALQGDDLDREFVSKIAAFCRAHDIEMVFHMAFDQISYDKQFKTLDFLVDSGFARILTHGGPSGSDILANHNRLLELIDYANNRITIMPGGGIHRDNLQAIDQVIAAAEYHGSQIV